jgi:hypothetical protein
MYLLVRSEHKLAAVLIHIRRGSGQGGLLAVFAEPGGFFGLAVLPLAVFTAAFFRLG